VKAVVVSKTIRYGKQHWRLNADGSWSVLAFGFFITTPHARTPRYGWLNVKEGEVPKEVKNLV
jgi:hypothetical protein